MSTDHFIDYHASRVFVRENFAEAGELPVVFVHGLGSASSIYDPAFAQPFLAGRALAFDFLGCGKSDKPGDFPYAPDDQADVLLAVLDHFGLSRVNLVAHSMGGVISILFAAGHPERVAHLVVAEANLDPAVAKISRKIAEYGSEERFAEAFDSFIGFYNRPNSPAALRFYATLVQTTPLALYRSASSLVARVGPDFYRTFLSLPMPKAFIRGEESYQSLPWYLRSAFDERGIPIVSISKAGHPMMEDQPEAFYAVVKELVDAPLLAPAP